MTQSQTFQLQKDNESLTARLIEGKERQIEIIWINERGDKDIGIYENGAGIKRSVLWNDKRSYSEIDFLTGYFKAYQRMGEELMAQIPNEWHSVLGDWLKPIKL
jgi:hypothetical protein